MYGYVNNSTGEFHLFASFEEAGDHAREQGLTSVHIRPVIAHSGSVTGIVNARSRAARESQRNADLAASAHARFLAGGR